MEATEPRPVVAKSNSNAARGKRTADERCERARARREEGEKNKGFLYRSEERRPERLQVLIQSGLFNKKQKNKKSPGHTVLEPRINSREKMKSSYG